MATAGGRRAKDPGEEKKPPGVERSSENAAGRKGKPSAWGGREATGPYAKSGGVRGGRPSEKGRARNEAARGTRTASGSLTRRGNAGSPRALGSDGAAGKEKRAGTGVVRASDGKRAVYRKGLVFRTARRRELDERGNVRDAGRLKDGHGVPSGARQKPVRRGRKRGSRKWSMPLLAALLLASLAAMVWVYLFTDVLDVRRVEVRGNRSLSADYLRSISGITPYTHILKMDVRAVERAILAEPYVLRVEVRRRFPHTVILEVTERIPVGCLQQNGRFHLVDREGLVVESADSRREGVPEITGLRPPLLYPGVKVEDPRFEDVARILEEIPEELRERAEEVGYAEGEGYYLVASETKVIFGECDDLERKAEIALAAMQDIAPRYGQLLYIDVTYPDHPAIRPR